MPCGDVAGGVDEHLGRHGLDGEKQGEALVLFAVDVHLDHVDLVGVLALQLSDPRRHHLAGKTIVAREADHHRARRSERLRSARGRSRCR